MNAEPLRKVLELEARKGYQNTAVFGGLDRFLGRWAAEAAPVITNRQQLRHFNELGLAKANYALMTPEQRREWAARVLDFISTTKLPPPGKKKREPGAAVKKTRRPAAKPTAARPSATTSLDQPITQLKGISTSFAARFAKLDVNTIRDLLYFFPRRHLDYSRLKTISQLTEGDEETIIANVWQARQVMLGRRRSTEVIVGDETGNVRAVWFSNPYLAKQLTTNKRIVLSGRVSLFNGRPVFESPEWETLEEKELIHTGRLVPVYHLTAGLRSRQVRKLMKEVVDSRAGQMADFLPPEMITRLKMLELPQAISQAHFPEDEEMKGRARLRLAFDELVLLQLGVLRRKRNWQQDQPANPLAIDTAVLETFFKAVPFELTGAQRKVTAEIMADLEKAVPMSRLLQGEVGSGKTVVATAALLMAAANGCQASLMAPTEILAEQHFASIGKLLSLAATEETTDGYLKSYSGLLKRPFTLALLLGDSKAAVKKELKKRIKTGEIDIVIGTHAIIQKGVTFKRLAVAVIDEQQRFGVGQRAALRQKGHNPHMLVMTATPIPRTLALTLYGDLDLSVIDELPPGRQPIKTKWLKPQQRQSAYAFLKKQIAGGRQAFIICPLVEESEAIAARAAVAEYESLSREVFVELRLGLIHGRLSAKEKDEVMRRFHDRQFDILVSTPVVEVGIDVPNATVMLIESADRFGLSQLHQFRGRVGRGEEQSYCLLLSEASSDVSRQRLGIIEKVQDGFALAEEDLKLRGPGEFFGTRQSGQPDLRMARLSDIALLELARSEALKIFATDPDLSKADHRPLAKELARIWPQATEIS
jgi:ATP-dependent DNA helicase RecG